MRWIVTGASGLIGRALVARLLAAGESVLALSRGAERFFAEASHPSLEVSNFDLATTPPEQLGAIDDEVGLIMLAARITTSADLREVTPLFALDVHGHARLAEWLGSRLRYGLYASSCTVYGHPDELPVDEEAPLRPRTPYAMSKVAAEAALGHLFAAWGIPLALMRIGQVYGPGAPEIGAIYGFLREVAAGRVPRITCNADAFRDYAHVDDVCQGLHRAMRERATGIYNLGSDRKVSVEQLAQICLDIGGRTDAPVLEPASVSWNMLMSSARARDRLGYHPAVSIEEGLRLEHQRLHQTKPLLDGVRGGKPEPS